MRSKWLNWTPDAEIIKETAYFQPAKPTKLSFDGFGGPAPADSSVIHSPKSTLHAISATIRFFAPRYDGGSSPLASIPKCWCCGEAWRLERLHGRKGKITYAFLQPGCSCLDVCTCYTCFVCRDHCRCVRKLSGSQTESLGSEKLGEGGQT